jgi:hypothetical protein
MPCSINTVQYTQVHLDDFCSALSLFLSPLFLHFSENSLFLSLFLALSRSLSLSLLLEQDWAARKLPLSKALKSPSPQKETRANSNPHSEGAWPPFLPSGARGGGLANLAVRGGLYDK